MYIKHMDEVDNPFNLSPVRDDLTHRRACFLAIDDQFCYIDDVAGKDDIEHYSMAMPKFIMLAGNYIDVVHISYLWPMKQLGDSYNPQGLQLRQPSLHFTETESPINIDFAHGFDPSTDLYCPKETADALQTRELADFLLRKNYGTVLTGGLDFNYCFSATHNGLNKLKRNHKPDLNIVAVCDLTNHPWTKMDMMEQKRRICAQLYDTAYVASAQDILSIWNPALDLDLPTVVNQAIIRNGL